MSRTRIYQYIEIIKFADRLTGIGLLNGACKKALDVGCGKGFWAYSAQILGYDVYGFDVNPLYIHELKNYGFKVTVGDCEHSIPFNDCFDLITCIEVVEHLKKSYSSN